MEWWRFTTDAIDGELSRITARPRHITLKIAPFGVLALVAEVSLALPPGPSNDANAYASGVLLALTVFFYLTTEGARIRPFALLVPLCYIASSLTLIIALGSSTTGVGLVMLLPILWAALYLEVWESVVVVLAVTIAEMVTTFTPIDLTNAVRVRRELSFLFIGGLIALTIHELRQRVRRSSELQTVQSLAMSSTIEELSEQTRITSVMSALVDMLNFCDVVEEAYEVFDFAARQIFDAGGSIYIFNPGADRMEPKCSWRTLPDALKSFSPDLCRAAVSGQPHESNGPETRCAHFGSAERLNYLCQPLLINQEITGLLVVAVTSETDSEIQVDAERYRQYARLLGDQIAIWLANFRLRESLKNLSIRDPLTNLFNRRFMIETLHREMAITSRSRDQTSIIQIDIDNFKDFNDSFGHEVGDAVLRAVSDVMFSLFRESDVPCRSGGEEFTLILPRCSWDIANMRAVELQSRVAVMSISVPENQVTPKPPTLSIGIATSPEHGLSGEELLRGADAAMYRAKNAGRNRIVRAEMVQAS